MATPDRNTPKPMNYEQAVELHNDAVGEILMNRSIAAVLRDNLTDTDDEKPIGFYALDNLLGLASALHCGLERLYEMLDGKMDMTEWERLENLAVRKKADA